eukprot:12714333-Alexandrium_andersonii.AAC.1
MSGTERPTSARQGTPRGSLDRHDRPLDRAAEGEQDAVERDNQGPVKEAERLGDLEARPHGITEPGAAHRCTAAPAPRPA